jgi:YggT family protein
MESVIAVVRLVVALFIVLLFGRIIFSWITHYAREWKPRGFALLLHEACYWTTDPVVKPLRRMIPPLNLGGIRFDLSITILIVALSFALGALGAVR